MNRGHSTENQWIEAIRTGGQARDRALEQLFRHAGYRSLVSKVVSEGGGSEVDQIAVFKECIVLLDRTLRLKPGRLPESFDAFFKKHAQQEWSERLAEDGSRRRQALDYVAKDAGLRERLQASIIKDGGTTATAEDCYQEGFLVLERQLAEAKYRGGALKGFFYQICYNLWRNERKKKKMPSLEESDPPPQIENETPQVLLELKEVNERWWRAFKALDARCRKILALKFFRRESLSMAEIAERMDLKNAQNASNALHRCKQRLEERAAS